MTEISGIIHKPSVLIVDDVAENIDILVGLLKGTYRVKAAADGSKALQIARSREPPDIILLDIMMPGMSGYDVCRKLKTMKSTRDIPVIFLTAISELDSLVKGFEAGGVDYIVKPFQPLELTTRLGTHLKLKDATDAVKNQNAVLESAVMRKTERLKQKNELLGRTLKEKETLLKEVRNMERALRRSLDMLNRLYERIQGIQEEERRKISTDIHDHLGQLLTAIKLNLFRLRERPGAETNGPVGRIDATIGMTDDALQAVQTVCKQLRPDILDNLGFSEAVRSYCRTMQESSGVVFTLAVEGMPGALGKKRELVLYRIIQEACTNTVRHAGAKKCEIEIGGATGALRLRIRDDGIGIGKDKIDDADSLGIFGMKKRIADIGGYVNIQGSPGKGTTVIITLPAGGETGD